MTALVQERKPLHLEEADASLSISSDDGDKNYEKEGETTSTSCLSSVVAMPSLYEELAFGDACSQDDTSSSSSISSCYLSADETDDDIELGSCCHPKRVTWSPTVVTETRYRLKTSPEDKELLHYTGADMLNFRQQYKMQLKAALKMKREREAQQRKEDTTDRSTSFQNPISGMINMMSSYLSKSSPSSSTSLTNMSINSASKRRMETTLLVDTLYLF